MNIISAGLTVILFKQQVSLVCLIQLKPPSSPDKPPEHTLTCTTSGSMPRMLVLNQSFNNSASCPQASCRRYML